MTATRRVCVLCGCLFTLVLRPCRHGASTRCVVAEVGAGRPPDSPPVLRQALGHARIETTTIDAHLRTAKRRDDLTRYLGA
jgi:hypothetical protein